MVDKNQLETFKEELANLKAEYDEVKGIHFIKKLKLSIKMDDLANKIIDYVFENADSYAEFESECPVRFDKYNCIKKCLDKGKLVSEEVRKWYENEKKRYENEDRRYEMERLFRDDDRLTPHKEFFL